MKKLLLLGLCLLCLGAQYSGAQYSGELLYQMLLEEERLSQGGDNIDELMVGVVTGYIGGIIEALELLGLFCIPGEVSMQQIRVGLLQYLREHPEDRKEQAIGIVVIALTEKGWICEK